MQDLKTILKLIMHLPFPVGKKTLTSILIGKETDSIRRHNFHKSIYFGALELYETHEIYSMIEKLVGGNCVESVKLGKYLIVLKITAKGKKLDVPQIKIETTIVTEKDREIFRNFDFFLGAYNDYQKKAIISGSKNILCVAGAGTGKTSVLTKRIEFLNKFRSVPAHRILAVTFTRKAKKEMVTRCNVDGVRIETFNSFAESILRQYNNQIYDRVNHVITYKQKTALVIMGLKEQNTSIEKAIDVYFTRKGKPIDELFNSFVSDVFSLLDHYKAKQKKIPLDSMLNILCSFIKEKMKEQGLRTFTDQLIDCIHFFEENPEHIPKYEHILVDEYQDINAVQENLIKLLNSQNLFCVGDPRQSIYGWRGSEISFILNFDYPEHEIVALRKNYRSCKNVVRLMNLACSNMSLPDLTCTREEHGETRLLTFSSEEDEYSVITQSIVAAHDSEIFVLARTHRQLEEMSRHLKEYGIPHMLRKEEHESINPRCVVLSTIHAVKGLEMGTVYVIGCNSANFPCKAGDHPFVELIEVDDYDKEAEERRLFYVAISRAKKKLILSYTGTLTYFVSPSMKQLFTVSKPKIQVNNKSDVYSELVNWRAEIADKRKVPSYYIMQEKTMQEIIARKPNSVSELTSVYGFGPVKAAKYGEDILKIIHG